MESLIDKYTEIVLPSIQWQVSKMLPITHYRFRAHLSNRRTLISIHNFAYSRWRNWKYHGSGCASFPSGVEL